MLTNGMFLQDRYEILEQIGSGGMSYVYKAKDAILDRYVAIKVIKSEYAQDMTYLTKFRAEAQSAAGLEHPNIVNVYDVGSDGGEHFIVMEYIEGITLKTYIEKKGRLTFKEATSIAIQVSRGIEAAHNKGIIHRDIKPQNIMISSEGKVKVTDFGIARATTGNTVSNEAMGSVHYISPEQARNGYVDQKSDIYSLGIVMFEMVTGHVPFDGDNAVSIAIQHLQQELPDIRRAAPDVPISLVAIIGKCTQKSPDKRYATLGELILDLKKALMNPNENFVVNPAIAQETRAISHEEMQTIRQEARIPVYVEEPREELPRKSRLYTIFDGDDDDYDDDYDDEDDDDEGEDGFLNPKIEKLITVLGIVTGIVIVAIVLFLILNFMGIIGSKEKKPDKEETRTEKEVDEDEDKQEEKEPEEIKSDKVEVVNVCGMTVEDATKMLNSMGLGLKVQGSIPSDEYEDGLVAEQSVEPGDVVDKKSIVYVKTSSGTGQIEVPSVEGYTESNAVSTLTNAKFNYTRSYSYSGTVASGYVISQSPAPGSMATEGDTVSIVVSQGSESVTVPDVTNLTQEAANSAITNAGLTVGTVTEEANDDIEAGKVISSSPSANASVEKGAKISLIISKGVQLYCYERTISQEEMDMTGCEALEIEIFDDNGKSLLQDADGKPIKGKIKAGSIITIKNIETEKGYMKVEGDTGELDANGSRIYFTNREDITFTKQ